LPQLHSELYPEFTALLTDIGLACRLNRTAAVVWKHCDGDHDVSELVEVLRDEIGELADEDLVMITLDQLQEQGLLASGHGSRDVTTARESRRRFIRRVGVVGAAALALPVVQSIVAPPARAAASTSGAAFTSLALPGVRWMTTGRPRTSVRLWTFVVWPPRDGPMACALAPLCRRARSDGRGHRCCRAPPSP